MIPNKSLFIFILAMANITTFGMYKELSPSEIHCLVFPSKEQWRLDNQLLEATKKGEYNTVVSLLRQGATAKKEFIEGTLLHVSTNVEVSRLLVLLGLDVNHESEDGTTPLINQAHNGRLDQCKFLLEKKADVNAQTGPTDWFATSLHVAAQCDHAPVCELLINHGAKIERPGCYGETALHMAARRGYNDTVMVLLTTLPLKEQEKIRTNTASKLITQEIIRELAIDQMDRIEEYALLKQNGRFSTAQELAQKDNLPATAHMLDLTNPASRYKIYRKVEKNIRSLLSSSPQTKQ